MVGLDFTYNGKKLSDFGMIMAKPSDTTNMGLNREILKGTTTINKKRPIHYGVKYTDTLVEPFFIIKNPILKNKSHTEQYHRISEGHLRKLSAWLTSPSTMRELEVLYDNQNKIKMNGVFNNITPYYVNGLNGLNLTFTSDSPFAYKEKQVKASAQSYTHITKIINCDSDELEDLIYPKIIVRPHNVSTTGNYYVKNKTTNKIMGFSLPSCTEAVIDTQLKRVTADGFPVTMEDLGWNINEIYDFNGVGTGTYEIYWFSLLPKMNEIVFAGNADFVIDIDIPIKVGGLP